MHMKDVKKIALMQPYLFPYLGYFQLVASVDEFIFYDDVNFIKQGWINRNRIRVKQKPFLFTVPVIGASSNRMINQTKIDDKTLFWWRRRFEKTLMQSYKNSPYLDVVIDLIKRVVSYHDNIACLASASVMACSQLLELNTSFKFSSLHYPGKYNRGKERIWQICHAARANTYINSMGGTALYDKREFLDKGINLYFMQPLHRKCIDENLNLSILHLLLELGPTKTRKLVEACQVG